tara:strand:+ start:580 stop:738 length:159 start_codon:yes stop_codon:yes gene_type:complete
MVLGEAASDAAAKHIRSGRKRFGGPRNAREEFSSVESEGHPEILEGKFKFKN